VALIAGWRHSLTPCDCAPAAPPHSLPDSRPSDPIHPSRMDPTGLKSDPKSRSDPTPDRVATSVTSAPAKAANRCVPRPMCTDPVSRVHGTAACWAGSAGGGWRAPGKVVLSLPAHRAAELASLATHNRLVGEGLVGAGTALRLPGLSGGGRTRVFLVLLGTSAALSRYLGASKSGHARGCLGVLGRLRACDPTVSW